MPFHDKDCIGFDIVQKFLAGTEAGRRACFSRPKWTACSILQRQLPERGNKSPRLRLSKPSSPRHSPVLGRPRGGTGYCGSLPHPLPACFVANSEMAEQSLSKGRGHRTQPRGLVDTEVGGVTEGSHHEIGTMKSNLRAKWSHEMKLFLIGLLKDHDVPGFRTQKAWSKEAWRNIVCGLNQKFSVSFTISQVKQKEQDLKKDYRSVKSLLDEGSFGWDSERNMVDAPDTVWASFASRRNIKDALQWRDKSFPYYDELIPLYEGRYAEGRTSHGKEQYASMSNHASTLSSHPAEVTEAYHVPSPTIPVLNESDLHFTLDDEVEDANLDPHPLSFTPRQHTQAPPRPAQTSSGKCCTWPRKRQKCDCDNGFLERYLKMKQEEIDLFAAIDKKLEGPYSITECITAIQKLDGLQIGDMLMAADIFRCRDNREIFMSFSRDELRLAWLTREIARNQTNDQN